MLTTPSSKSVVQKSTSHLCSKPFQAQRPQFVHSFPHKRKFAQFSLVQPEHKVSELFERKQYSFDKSIHYRIDIFNYLSTQTQSWVKQAVCVWKIVY